MRLNFAAKLMIVLIGTNFAAGAKVSLESNPGRREKACATSLALNAETLPSLSRLRRKTICPPRSIASEGS